MTRRVIAIALAAAVVVGAGAYLLSGGGGSDNLVRAEFSNAAGLRPGSLVRVGGATVGSVRSLKVTARDTAAVELALKDHVRPGAGAAAAIRPANLLGEKFVDLTIGDRARPLTSGSIPRSRTSTPVELDDVLNVLDSTTRGRLALLLGELGVALGGRGDDLEHGAGGAAQHARRRGGPAVRAVDARPVVLERLLVEADAVTGTRRPRAPRPRRAGHAPAPARSPRRPRAARGLDRTLREAPPHPGAAAGDAAPAGPHGHRATARRPGTALERPRCSPRRSAPCRDSTRRPRPRCARSPTSPRRWPTSAAAARPSCAGCDPTAASLRALATDADPLTKSLDDERGQRPQRDAELGARDPEPRRRLAPVPRVAELHAGCAAPARRVREARAPPARRRARKPAVRGRRRSLPDAPLDRVVAPVKKVLDDATRETQPVTRLLDFLLKR